MREAPGCAGRQAERGQAIVEFALIVPMLFIMLVGVVYFAMGFNLQQVLNNAAYEGARVWAKNPPAGSYTQCSPPACDPQSTAPDQNNFEQYIIPLVRRYVTEHGYDGSQVIFFSEDRHAFENALSRVDRDPELVTITIYYPYSLPIGNFAASYLAVKITGSCTLKRG
jgi:hypothetical protein